MKTIQRFIRAKIANSLATLSRATLACMLALTALIADAYPLSHFPSPPGQTRRQNRKQPKKPVKPALAAQSVSPDEAFNRARSADSQNDRIDLLEKFISSYKDSPLIPEAHELLMREYALRGEQHLREGSPQLATRDFKSVFRHAPAEMNDRIFGQFIFPLPMAMGAFGYRTESVELMRSFEGRFDTDVNRLVQIGFFYVQIEAPLEAVRVLERTVSMAPNDHRAHNGLGTAYLINLRLEDATAEFEKAIEINASDEFANLNLANLYRAAGDNRQAVEYYSKQIALKPGDAEAHGGLALALLALGRDEEAEREIKRATELTPEDYRLLTQLAFFYANRRKPEIARVYMEQAARLAPRYAWVFIAKANIDALEAKYGDALATIIQAQPLGGFSTLKFELAKTLMALDGYDQALEVMREVFSVSEDGEFETTLGGVMRARSPRLDMLLERERRAALLLNDYPTTTMQYRLAEALFRMDHFMKVAARKKSLSARGTPVSPPPRRRGRAPGRSKAEDEDLKSATRPRRASGPPVSPEGELSAGRDEDIPGVKELLHATRTFTTLDDGRQVFRMVWVARKLTDSGIALDAAEQLALRAIARADAATEPAGSMRDAPLLDREGRRAVFLGRAYDALGWAMFKKGNTQAAIEQLAKSVDVYPLNAERKTALWHLAVATEQAGDERRALDFYIASYESGLPTSNVRRAHIENLYKKLNGSLDGLEKRLPDP
ncbi:MAG: tetratricopeptide repeat protein [Blastocatellia bacterium]|nr:tetratricopeptide repeat protein [Blastocatellia bacterium]